MIKIKFRQLAENHRFSIQFIHNKTGLSRNTLTELYYERIKRLDLDTINTLCKFFNEYFPCSLSDILEYITDE